MTGFSMYWLEDDSVSFATFLTVIQAYYHPEVRLDNFDELIQLARRGEGGERMAIFKDELTRLLVGDREGLRPTAISVAAGYDDWATDDEFLEWLWHELYPDEPAPSAARGDEASE